MALRAGGVLRRGSALRCGRRAASAASAEPAAPSSYERLAERLRESSALSGISGLLEWDSQVMMPPGAAASRAAQTSALAGVLHERSTSAELGELLAAAEQDAAQLGPYEAAVVRDARRSYDKKVLVPKELAQREARLGTVGYQAWGKAREEDDFESFAPVLREWVDIWREKAAAVAPDVPVYDACLDDFERGLTEERLKSVFDEVKAGLVPLIEEIQEHGTAPDKSWLAGDFDTDVQAAFCKDVCLALGFDTDRGRLDVSLHPFTGGAHPTDVRMTTRFKRDDLFEGLTGAVHETGHALYEQGRSTAYEGLPVSEALSMGIHESQSLMWERMVALSRPFAEFLLPKLYDNFGSQLPAGKTADDLYGAMNVVRAPADRLIRVESDEVTYSMHVILRFELESALVRGEIDVADLPELWNQKMQQYLGVTPPSNKLGVLQDVHWAAGAAGYFPTYSLGAMYAVQLNQEAHRRIEGLDEQIAAGDFTALKTWLNESVHSVGSLYPSGDELMTAVTGEPLKPSIFLEHLRSKYSAIYGLK